MSALSDYLENELLDHIVGAASFTPPANLFFAAFTTDPTDAGTGTEASGGSYARVSVTNNLTNFPAASAGSKSNANAITFPEATASWGTISHVGIYDASTAGNLLWHGALTTSKAIGSGDTLSFAAGDLTFTLA